MKTVINGYLKIITFCLFAIVISSCGEDKTGQINNIERILYDGQTSFTILINNNGIITPKKIFVSEINNISFVIDVPDKDKMWAKFTACPVGTVDYQQLRTIEFHLHSTKDVNGSDHSYGRGIRKKINVID